MREEWRPVTGYEGIYEVSNLGLVRSLDRLANRKNGPKLPLKGKVLKPGTRPKGHLHVVLSSGGRTKTTSVHKIVLEAFVGKCPKGMECRHLNGDPSDNGLKNICWGTPKENMGDKIRHGRNGFVLTKRDVIRIRGLLPTKPYKEIAKQFGVTESCIYAIAKGKTWWHVGPSVDRKGFNTGERQHNSKLTEDDVICIRRLSKSQSQSKIARDYGVDQSLISRIVRGQYWSHVT